MNSKNNKPVQKQVGKVSIVLFVKTRLIENVECTVYHKDYGLLRTYNIFYKYMSNETH